MMQSNPRKGDENRINSYLINSYLNPYSLKGEEAVSHLINPHKVFWMNRLKIHKKILKIESVTYMYMTPIEQNAPFTLTLAIRLRIKSFLR